MSNFQEQKYPDIISELENSKNIIEINPAQDYIDENIIYSFKKNDKFYLVSSDKNVLKYEDLEEYALKNNRKQTVLNLRPKAVIDYVKGKTVNPIDLFNKISCHLKRYIVFEDVRHFSILSLWIIGTYLYRGFRYYPYIWLTADKGSGKSRVMEIVSPLAFNAIMATNHSEASIFRLIDTDGCTLLIDEFEKMKKDNQQGIINILNAGFNIEGNVVRNEKKGDTYIPTSYSAYSPKIFAGINDISDVLMDRCIKIKMFKKPSNVIVQRYKNDPQTMENIMSIRDELYIFGLQYGPTIKEIYDNNEIILPEELSDRECDIWEVLFAISKIIDCDRILSLEDLIKKYAIQSSLDRSRENIDQNNSYKLISVLIDVIPTLKPIKEDGDKKYYDSDDVLKNIKNTDEFCWVKSKNYLTKSLNKLNIDCSRITIGGKKIRVYEIANNKLVDLVNRYNLKEIIDM